MSKALFDSGAQSKNYFRHVGITFNKSTIVESQCYVIYAMSLNSNNILRERKFYDGSHQRSIM